MARGGLLSDSDRVILERFPVEALAGDLNRCFLLRPDDLDLVWQRVGPAGRLAGGLQVGALRLLGFAPEDLASAPTPVVESVAVDLVGNSSRSVDSP